MPCLGFADIENITLLLSSAVHLTHEEIAELHRQYARDSHMYIERIQEPSSCDHQGLYSVNSEPRRSRESCHSLAGPLRIGLAPVLG